MYKLLEIGETVNPTTDERYNPELDRWESLVGRPKFLFFNGCSPVRRKVDGVIVDKEKWQKVIDTVQWWYDLADKNV